VVVPRGGQRRARCRILDCMSDFDALALRRARALRAARTATLSASLAGLAACGGTTDTPDAFATTDPDAFVAETPDAPTDAQRVLESGADVFVADQDAPFGILDAAIPGGDAPSATEDAYTFTGDAGCGPDFPPTNQACCVLAGGFWDGETGFCAIAVPGPFVPPSLEA